MADEAQMTARLYASVSRELPRFAAIRRDLHQHPETAFEETRTADIVAGLLASWGIEVHRGLAKTGVVGVLRRGTGTRSIALRADMDALDMDEANEFAHRSSIPGKMHGCGHDGHTASLLAAADHLARQGRFNGTVCFIFQPAEENEGGGRAMIEAGLFDRFPCEAVFGLHNIPGIAVGSFALRPGAMMAGFDTFDIEFVGRGGHAAMPHTTLDPIPAAASFVLAAQTIVSRNLPPEKAAVLSVTRFAGGSAYNVIPERAALAGTVRYFDPAVRERIEERLRATASGIAAAHGVEAVVRYDRRYPATLNSPAETEFCARVLTAAFGADRVDTDPRPLMASEDFAFMLEARPGCYVWTGNGDGEGSCMVHNPRYDFNDAVIPYAATYWVKLVEAALP